jgi:acetyl-CoA C-acetyltransferase
MGTCAEMTAEQYKISREVQDQHAVESYTRAADAWKKGLFTNEIVSVKVTGHKGDVMIDHDEEYKNVAFDKIPKLKSAFKKDGTVTAANSSTLNDDASALVLMSR